MRALFRRFAPVSLGLALVLSGSWWAGGATFRVATYNLENYLDEPARNRFVKSAEARAKIRESIRALRPDVLALQEMGGTNALLDLRDSLKAEGLDLPYWEHVSGFDTNIHVAILSRLPILTRRPHPNENFLLSGRRFQVSRGFGEVDLQAGPNFVFTLFTAHLKSKRPSFAADEADIRLEEAKLLREKIDARLAADPNAAIVVAGDFNDTKDAASTRAVIGRGKLKLVDTRPAESNGDTASSANPSYEPRKVTWTHYYSKEDSYSRIDYLLLSKAMARHWLANESCVLALPNWGVGSDHRPIVAAFTVDE